LFSNNSLPAQVELCYTIREEYRGNVSMKAKTAAEATLLEHIPNVGKAVANDLRSIGINHPQQLVGKNGITLYHQLNRITGLQHDPCMADTLMAVVDFMNGGKAKPWWKFTAMRKELLNRPR
jgi:hypothetical protein